MRNKSYKIKLTYNEYKELKDKTLNLASKIYNREKSKNLRVYDTIVKHTFIGLLGEFVITNGDVSKINSSNEFDLIIGDKKIEVKHLSLRDLKNRNKKWIKVARVNNQQKKLNFDYIYFFTLILGENFWYNFKNNYPIEFIFIPINIIPVDNYKKIRVKSKYNPGFYVIRKDKLFKKYKKEEIQI